MPTLSLGHLNREQMNINVYLLYAVKGETRVPLTAWKSDSVSLVSGISFLAGSLLFLEQPSEEIQFLKPLFLPLWMLGEQEGIPANGASGHFLCYNLVVKSLIHTAGGWGAVPCLAGLIHSPSVIILGDNPSSQTMEHAEWKHSACLLLCIWSFKVVWSACFWLPPWIWAQFILCYVG